MTGQRWQQVVENGKVPARPDGGLWTFFDEIVNGPCLIKIEAEGEWHYAEEPEAKCGPDGQTASYISSSRCANPKGPVGALIGKIGGSTADTGDETSFVVGRFCVHKHSEGTGALFLTINDVPSGYEDNQGEVTVQVYMREIADTSEP